MVMIIFRDSKDTCANMLTSNMYEQTLDNFSCSALLRSGSGARRVPPYESEVGKRGWINGVPVKCP